jgi:OmpA-OmpF porin, OOP family
MRAKSTLAIVSTFLFVSGFPLLKSVQAESQADAIKERAAAVAEEKAEIAKEEAEIDKAAAELKEKTSALAEKKAALAKKESDVNEEIAAQAQRLEQELAKRKAEETERGLVLTLGDVLFESNMSDLKTEALHDLYVLVTFLKEHPDRNILIEGYTDNVGAEGYNLELSQRRAAAVRHFLVHNGIDPERVTARGYGQAYPVASNTTKVGRQDNRRVEVVILRGDERVAERMR